MADYQEQFLTFLARCADVTEPQQIAIFTAGLGDPLGVDVELQRPSSLEDAMGLARAFERRLTITDAAPSAATRGSNLPAPSRSTSSTTSPQHFANSPPATTPNSTPQQGSRPRPAPGARFSRSTPEEMAKRREEGLCFNCPAKFTREHLKECTMRGIYLLEVEGETELDDSDSDNVQISANAITGIASSKTMQLLVALSSGELRAPVDSGSTHCFIAEEAALASASFRPRDPA